MADNQRFLALDVFRGMTVCFMIIVNNPGSWSSIYSPLTHAGWHGFTPTDLVFPSFLFAVGNAMAFVMHKYEAQGDAAFWRKTLKRTLIIFLIGYLISWFPFYDFNAGHFRPIGSTRILGVLQRIALCYFFASIIIHYCSRKMTIAISIALLLGYWIILYVFGDPNDPYSLSGYAGNALDFLVLGKNHLYRGEGVPFDPEGILSTLPAIVNVIGGYLAGDFIRRHGNTYETIAKLLLAGCALILIALTWHLAFPINKKIWTSSFVLVTVGISLTILPALMYVIEILKKRGWTNFFVVFGRNPLFIYLLSDVLIILFHLVPVGDKMIAQWLYRDVFGSFASPINASLLFALFFMLLNWSVGYWLDRRKIYIRV
ncbi:MAG TPA: heparan-alpha-glucosaminide N-acetyltransferase domain-containing protein [Ohtaekwangia sp.]|nr:heparan-alpha-glucosaminide N-acetyltransferase domain-containing protein [Ohtaekwangia sp.]